MNHVTNELLEKVLPFRTTQIRLAHLMQHLANHSTYHRGQVALMIRQPGERSLPPRTFMYFWRSVPMRQLYISAVTVRIVGGLKLLNF